MTKLGFDYEVDKEKIVTSGHSFGGITAIRAAVLDKRVKAVLSMDPWTWIHDKDILEGKMKINCPLIAVNT